MKDADLIGLVAFAAFWLIFRERQAQKKRVEEAEKRAVDRDAKTRAVLLERINDLEATLEQQQETDSSLE